MGTERVEFVDSEATGAGDEDVLSVGGPDGDGGGRPGRWGLAVIGLVVVALLGALLVGRLAVDGPVAPTVTATPSRPFIGRPSEPVTTPKVGLVGLPQGISEPRELVTNQVGDVVWMLDRGSGVVRIENGVVTAEQDLESQATAIAVNPSGTRLYVATGARRPSIQELDANSLVPGVSRPLTAGSVSSMVVTIDAVWAASGSSLFRLDVLSLQPLSTLVMPGVVITEHLRVGSEQTSDAQVVTGLVTGTGPGGTTTSRFLRVDTLTQLVSFGNPIPHVVDMATAQFLTWVTFAATAGGAQTTDGYASVVDRSPSAQATPALAPGTRIYDGGGGFAAFLSVAPRSSVLQCHDDGGFATGEVDVAPALPDAIITGEVARTDTAFYVITDRGLVRQGAGACR